MAKGNFRGWLYRVKVFQAVGFAFLVLMFGCVKAGDWTTADTARQATFTALLVVDWSQTRYGAQHPDQFKEYNRPLGEHPTTSQVNRYFLTYAVGHAAISYLLPPEWRHAWQYIYIGIEGDAVSRNYGAGVRMTW